MKEKIIYIDTDKIENEQNKLKEFVGILNNNYNLIKDFNLSYIKQLTRMAENSTNIYNLFFENTLKQLYRENGFDETQYNNIYYDMLNNPILSKRKRNELRDKAINQYQTLPKLFIQLHGLITPCFDLIDYITFNPLTKYGISNKLSDYLLNKYTYTAKSEEQIRMAAALQKIADICNENGIEWNDLKFLFNTNAKGKIIIDTDYFLDTYR